MTAGYWPSRWPGEDGGPDRRQLVGGGSGLGLVSGGRLEVVSREAMASTMVILRMAGEVYLLCHTAGDDAVSWVERIDPVTLELIERSPDLPGGPTWPGGLAAHANGSLYVVFGNHAHRLAADTSLVASRELPRVRPYNSFVILDDGSIVTKDFAGRLPGQSVEQGGRRESELVVLEPDGLEIVARTELAEPSVARLSAAGSGVFVDRAASAEDAPAVFRISMSPNPSSCGLNRAAGPTTTITACAGSIQRRAALATTGGVRPSTRSR